MNAITLQRVNVAPLEFTTEQRKMIRETFLSGASEAEASVLLEVARVRRLNPITRQIHFVKRWDSDKQRDVWACQVGIDGFRSIAERTGLYDGQDEPEFIYDKDTRLVACKVRVYRKDWSRPSVGVAHYSEFVQLKKDKSPTRMWAEKPHVMLAKCAEAIGFRKGFPEDTSGLYAPEEMPDMEAHAAPPTPPLGPIVNQPAPSLPASSAPPQSQVQSQTDKVAAKVAAKAAEKLQTPRGPVKVGFGPSKNKLVADLTAAELTSAIALAEQKLEEAPSAEWAGPLAAALADLKAEHADRIERAIDAEAAEKAAKAKAAADKAASEKKTEPPAP